MSVVELEPPPVSLPAPVTTLRIVLLGYGRIGQAVAELARANRARLLAAGVDLHFIRALVRDPEKSRSGPILPLTDAPDDALAGADVAIEVLGGVEPARTLVARALEAGVPVISANKTLVATCGPELVAIARRRRTAFAYEAAVLAGVPFVGALQRRPLAADASRLEGIVNGTSNFILSAMATGAAFAEALRTAIAHGYAEPESDADISGRDAAEKLTILLRLCGWPDASTSRLPRTGIDVVTADDVRAAAELGGAIRPVAIAVLDATRGGDSGAWVGPAFVPHGHPLAGITGVGNALRILGPGPRAMTFSGPGAGPEVTAATLLDDLVEVAGASPRSAATLPEPPPRTGAGELGRPPAGRWFIGLRTSTGSDAAHVIALLTKHGVSPVHVSRSGDRLHLLTLDAPWRIVSDARRLLAAIGLRPVVLPALATSL